MDFSNFPLAAIGALCVVAIVSGLNYAGLVRRYGVLIGVGPVVATLLLGYYGAGFPALTWGL